MQSKISDIFDSVSVELQKHFRTVFSRSIYEYPEKNIDFFNEEKTKFLTRRRFVDGNNLPFCEISGDLIGINNYFKKEDFNNFLQYVEEIKKIFTDFKFYCEDSDDLDFLDIFKYNKTIKIKINNRVHGYFRIKPTNDEYLNNKMKKEIHSFSKQIDICFDKENYIYALYQDMKDFLHENLSNPDIFSNFENDFSGINDIVMHFESKNYFRIMNFLNFILYEDFFASTYLECKKNIKYLFNNCTKGINYVENFKNNIVAIQELVKFNHIIKEAEEISESCNTNFIGNIFLWISSVIRNSNIRIRLEINFNNLFDNMFPFEEKYVAIVFSKNAFNESLFDSIENDFDKEVVKSDIFVNSF